MFAHFSKDVCFESMTDGDMPKGYAQQYVPSEPKGLQVRLKDSDWTLKKGKAHRLAAGSPEA